MSGGVACTDPRVQRVRRQDSLYAPALPLKDIRLAPSTHKENLESSPLAGVKRAPSFGALAQEAKRERQVFGGPLTANTEDNNASAYPSSDEEEKVRAKGTKKMRVKDSGLAPAISLNTGTPPNTPPPVASPKRARTKVPTTVPPCLPCKSLALPQSLKSPTPKPKKRSIVPRDVPPPECKTGHGGQSAAATKEVRKRPGAPMNLIRNPSMFGAELPHLLSSVVEPLCPRLQASPALSGQSLEQARLASPDTSPQRPKTLRRVQRVTLGRRISFSSLATPVEDVDADDENASGLRRERQRQRELGQLGSAFQLH
ncbi:hypothetical protein H0H87_010979 [Tephrocybe sp. NHM501043]|nr:hypothetical protein H0H87_010979 [Tephrocybe sp. NHM501043]